MGKLKKREKLVGLPDKYDDLKHKFDTLKEEYRKLKKAQNFIAPNLPAENIYRLTFREHVNNFSQWDCVIDFDDTLVDLIKDKEHVYMILKVVRSFAFPRTKGLNAEGEIVTKHLPARWFDSFVNPSETLKYSIETIDISNAELISIEQLVKDEEIIRKD